MAAMVERARGRDALVKLLCDPRQLLAAYNELAAAHPRSDGEGLATWSPDSWRGLPLLLRRPHQHLVDRHPARAGHDVGDGIRDVLGLHALDVGEALHGLLGD